MNVTNINAERKKSDLKELIFYDFIEIERKKKNKQNLTIVFKNTCLSSNSIQKSNAMITTKVRMLDTFVREEWLLG